MQTYRGGGFEAAVTALAQHPAPALLPREVNELIDGARRAGRRQDLEAALMLVTELAFNGWSEGAQLGLTPWLRQVAVVVRLHDAVKGMAPRTPFLREWYLLWESFYQRKGVVGLPDNADFLLTALQTFPDDPELMLAAGSRYEVRWWMSIDNPQRHPSGAAGTSQQFLTTARGWLRKAAARSPDASEVRLRLGRVLFLLGDLDEADAELRRFKAAAKDPISEYLVQLFLGDICERRGDRAAARAAYEKAVDILPDAQSGRLAAAWIAYVEGLRPVAAETVVTSLSEPSSQADPWWWYVLGQAWQFDNHLTALRALITGATRQ
jgi:tetratricopeptide (TPR) repeat protein